LNVRFATLHTALADLGSKDLQYLKHHLANGIRTLARVSVTDAANSNTSIISLRNDCDAIARAAI
jgi:hypothetical protein